MDQSNNIANFGRNAGNNVLASYLAGADQKRQKTNDFYNRIFQQDQLKKQDEQIEYKRQQDQYNKEKELSLGVVQALASTNDPNQRAQIYQGYRQTAIGDLGVDAAAIPETYSDEIFNKLVGATGYDLSRGQKSPAEVQALLAKFELAGLPPEERQRATRINLGLDGRAVGSAAQTIANTQGQTEIVANSESAIKGRVAGSQEVAKLTAQQRLKPLIAEAEQAAKSRGEKLSDLNQAKAALPGLNEVVEDLRQLAPIATSTRLGGAFDVLAKEAGFGATEGATAKAKYIAIVSNQVLPLLKQTFGGAFTVAEGDELKKTLGDPNGSPEEKIAQLEAFIEQKYREVETRERELGIGQQSEALGGDENSAALNWARRNPNDPRAQQILQLLGN